MTDITATNAVDNQMMKEDYLVLRAKQALATDVYAAKTWLVTAKCLFPHSSKVQFEAYKLEKLSKNIKEAAQCFSEIFQNFPDDPDIWKEIEMITGSLRTEHTNGESDFLIQMFQNMPQDLQHRLLIMTADRSEDTMEHCKLLLLLLKRFPQTVSTHGSRLVETLLTAEKHSHPGRAVNDIRRLLACDALPLLGAAPVELNPRLSLRLLIKSIEFYLAYIQQPQDNNIQQPWDRMFQIVELMGKKLCWELGSLFATPWNRELYCERLQQYETKYMDKLNDETFVRQLMICTIVVLLRILYEHNKLISNGDSAYCLVEAFIDPVLSTAEPKLKKRKRDDSMSTVITSDAEYSGNGLSLAVKLWTLLHSSDCMQRDLTKLNHQLRLESDWLGTFLLDLGIYKGLHVDVLSKTLQEPLTLTSCLKLASTYFFLKDYKTMFGYITLIAEKLPTNRGKISQNLVVPGVRHVHYLPLARFPVLQYCCRLLISAIKDNFTALGEIGDFAIGHALVLMQMDWPQQSDLLTVATERIFSRGSFTYPIFQSYVINVDIIEELTYLWTEGGGGIYLDVKNGPGIAPNRRMSTRGADKGVREEIKQIMRRQVARDGVEPLDELIHRFLINEKTSLQHCLVAP